MHVRVHTLLIYGLPTAVGIFGKEVPRRRTVFHAKKLHMLGSGDGGMDVGHYCSRSPYFDGVNA